MAPLPTARTNLATAEVGGLVYAVGGFTAVDTLNVVEKFDPRSGRWATGLPLPQPRGAPGAAGLGGLLYVAGGFIPLSGNDFEITNSMIVYNPRNNTWRSVAPMPTARERLRLVASGRYLYAIGGDDLAGQSLTTVERYDPKSNSWTIMNPMHESRVVPGAVKTRVEGRNVIVVVGGVEFSANGTFVGPSWLVGNKVRGVWISGASSRLFAVDLRGWGGGGVAEVVFGCSASPGLVDEAETSDAVEVEGAGA